MGPISTDLKLRVAKDVLLRAWLPDDAAQLWGLTNRQRENLGRWLGWPDETRSIDDAERFVAYTRDAMAKGTGCDLALVVAGRFAGGMGLSEIHRGSQRGTLGYWLSRHYAGQGLMTSAGRVLIAYAFEELELQRLELWTMSGNVRSRRLAERLGFSLEGILRQRKYHRGRLHDRVVYGLVREDWWRDHAVPHIGFEEPRNN